MQSVSVAEAQKRLGSLVEQALGGERVMIHQGTSAVVLQPVIRTTGIDDRKLTPLQALERLKEFTSPSSEEADAYIREVYAERRACE